ncbi:MAG: lipoate--protein ligase [Ruminococcaceae bacterium]|nr:lipoate--protein ligase [Oscillospiraceae bacterium]
MIIIKNKSTDPYFNLAAEEYITDNLCDDVFMLWQNSRSVIIGKNQNAFAELDRAFIEEHGIKVVRRLTGGGAVFHDIGNVNYTFITKKGEGSLDFARFCAPVIESLKSLGVEAVLTGRNDIAVGGAKISGTAQCVRGERLIHHGTLLFDADLTEMEGALRPDPLKLQSKGINSVRSRVTNLKPLLSKKLETGEFIEYIERYVSEHAGITAVRELTDKERVGIQKLADSKYSAWEWNFGASKSYSRRERRRFPFGTVQAELEVSEGRIALAKISGDFFGTRDISELETLLLGTRFEFDDICTLLDVSSVSDFVAGSSPKEIAALIMGVE